MTAAEFVGMLWLARNVTHSVHLNTNSYAKHKALNEFYDEIIPLSDDFAEAWQGAHLTRIGDIKVPPVKNPSNITNFLINQLEEIGVVRYQVIKVSETSLQNIIDEIVALYQQTIYKLKFLT